MEGRGCREWIGGEKNSECHGGKGALIAEREKKRGRERKDEAALQGMTQEKLFAQTTDWEKEKCGFPHITISTRVQSLKF